MEGIDWLVTAEMECCLLTILSIFFFGDSVASAPVTKDGENPATACYKDWVFINYTFKRFEGLTQRGVLPSHMKK